MARERRGHNPFMMRFMQPLVYERVVQPPMNPIDEKVGEQDEEGELNDVVEQERSVRGRVVKFSMAADFAEKAGCGQESYERDGGKGLLDLEADLVLEIFRMCEGCVVENEEVGEGCAAEIDDSAEKATEGSAKSGKDFRRGRLYQQIK